jgi:hypothetical protein
MHKHYSRTAQTVLSLSIAIGLAACGGATEAPGSKSSSAANATTKAAVVTQLAAAVPYPLAKETTVSLQVKTAGYTDRYIRHGGGLASTTPVDENSAQLLKNDATYRVVTGLADGNCYSLRSRNYPDRYLRHANHRVRLDTNDNTDLFKRDATFCTRAGLSGSGVSFEALNVPGNFLRHYNGEVWIAAGGGARPSDSANSFAADASWDIANPWGWAPLSAMAAPPANWQEHWFDHKQNLSRVFYNDDLVTYFDGEVDRSQTWMNSYITNVWRYTKRTYGDFGDDRLFAVFHTGKYSGGHPSTRFDASHDYRNVIDVGPGPWNNSSDLDLITHEISHIVEIGSKGVLGSPAFGTWGDSKWAEIFIYDVYRGLGLKDQETRAYNQFMAGTDNFPRAGTRWFKDWFIPIYNGYGQSKVINNYFNLVSRCYPRNGQSYSRSMNMGEFVHFWSGAAGVNLKSQATAAFGWTDDYNNQLIKAQSEFACAVYPR